MMLRVDYFQKVLLETTKEGQSMHNVSFIDEVTQGKTAIHREWLVESYKEYNGRSRVEDEKLTLGVKSKPKSVI